MTVGDDEARAAAYRAQTARREAFRAEMRARLAGDPVAAAELRANYQPLTDAANDAGGPWDDFPEPAEGHANG